MTPWLSVVGIGEDGFTSLPEVARALATHADTLFGGERHLAMVPPGAAHRVVWGSPFHANLDRIAALRGQRVCVLASGDPMWFGIGATLARRFDPAEMTVLPQAGAFSLAAARLGWAVQDVACLTVHGRPLEALRLHLCEGARLLVLAEDGGSPAAVAELLTAAGCGPSPMVVFERLGCVRERRTEATAATWTAPANDLNTIAVEVRAQAGARLPSRVPGLPDDAYRHDGQLTKQEVRAVTLAALAPRLGALLWDVGAGSGAVAIEWMRAGGRAVAVERSPARLDLIARNAAALGVPTLSVVAAQAPDGLADLPPPDAVFVGGGVSAPAMLETCWHHLAPGGRLVANAVSVEAEARLLDWHAAHPGAMTRLAVARLAATGRFHTWHPLMPVTQYVGVKA